VREVVSALLWPLRAVLRPGGIRRRDDGRLDGNVWWIVQRLSGPSTGNGSSSTTGEGGTTGLGPYQGFDSGPRNEPPIAPGCTAQYPFADGLCVQCLNDADCPSDWYCATMGTELPYQCYRCRSEGDGGAVGCSEGEVCDLGDVFPVCLPDCRQPVRDAHPTPTAILIAAFASRVPQRGGLRRRWRDLPPGRRSGLGVRRMYSGDAGCPRGQLCNSGLQCEANCLDAGMACAVDSYCNAASGLCTIGCVTNTDCGGATPFCETDIVPHACAQCLTAADCPPGTMGCFRASLNRPALAETVPRTATAQHL